MYGIVYLVHNKVNGKNYIGQTTENLIKRKSSHYYRAKKCNYNYPFLNALRKYKKFNWEWEILGYATCQLGLNILEKLWIWLKNSISPRGYNLKEGGSHGKMSEKSKRKMSIARKGNKYSLGYKFIKEQRINMSKSMKGIKRKSFTKEHLINMGKAKKGNKNALGYRHTKEACRKMSEAQKGKRMSAERYNARAIQCIETGKIYDSTKEAIRKTGIFNIGNRKYKTAGGFHWRFV